MTTEGRRKRKIETLSQGRRIFTLATARKKKNGKTRPHSMVGFLPVQQLPLTTNKVPLIGAPNRRWVGHSTCCSSPQRTALRSDRSAGVSGH